MKEEKWWKFDDNRVSRVWDMDEMIEDCRHNGYMLNYMKQEKVDKQNEWEQVSYPQYISKAMDLEIQLNQLEKQKIQFAKDMINIKVYYKLSHKIMQVNNKDTYQYLLLMAIN